MTRNPPDHWLVRAARAGGLTDVADLRVPPGTRTRLAGLEVVGVLAKPFDPMLLAGQVAALLGWDA